MFYVSLCLFLFFPTAGVIAYICSSGPAPSPESSLSDSSSRSSASVSLPRSAVQGRKVEPTATRSPGMPKRAHPRASGPERNTPSTSRSGITSMFAFPVVNWPEGWFPKKPPTTQPLERECSKQCSLNPCCAFQSWTEWCCCAKCAETWPLGFITVCTPAKAARWEHAVLVLFFTSSVLAVGSGLCSCQRAARFIGRLANWNVLLKPGAVPLWFNHNLTECLSRSKVFNRWLILWSPLPFSRDSFEGASSRISSIRSA